jgi:hypothetical protein
MAGGGGLAETDIFSLITANHFFSLSSSEGGEGRGEEAFFSSSNPLTPPLSPLGRGEGDDGKAGCGEFSSQPPPSA